MTARAPSARSSGVASAVAELHAAASSGIGLGAGAGQGREILIRRDVPGDQPGRLDDGGRVLHHRIARWRPPRSAGRRRSAGSGGHLDSATFWWISLLAKRVRAASSAWMTTSACDAPAAAARSRTCSRELEPTRRRRFGSLTICRRPPGRCGTGPRARRGRRGRSGRARPCRSWACRASRSCARRRRRRTSARTRR